MPTIRIVLTLLAIGVAGADPPLVRAQPPTPAPGMTLGTCPAVVTFDWDVSSVPGASGVFWELKRGRNFASPERPDRRRIDQGSTNGETGELVLDLRDYGPVLDGTRYYFRIVATGMPRAKRPSFSRAVVFREKSSLNGAFEVQDATRIGNAHLIFTELPPAIERCADRAIVEVKEGGPFSGSGSSGSEVMLSLTLSQFTSSLQLGVVGESAIEQLLSGPGDHHVRVSAFYGGNDPGSTVGRPGSEGPVDFTARRRLEVTVIDEVARDCATTARAADATVTAEYRPQGLEPSYGLVFEASTGENGTAVLEIPQGDYDISVEKTGCGTAGERRDFHLASATAITMELPQCPHEHDLAVEFDPSGPIPASRQGATIPFALRGGGTGPAPPRQATVTRDGAPVATETAANVCPGVRREIEVVDRTAESGRTYTYAVELTTGEDADPSNDRVERKIRIREPRRTARPVATVRRASADLTVEASQSADPLIAGERQSYRVDVGNEGTADARQVVVEMELPAPLDHVSSEGDAGFSCTSTGATLRCSGGKVTRGDTARITVRADLPIAAAAGQSLPFEVRVDPEDRIGESDEGDNTASVVATSGDPPMAEYSLPVGAVLTYAHSRGFTSTAEKDLPGTFCSLDRDTGRIKLKIFGIKPTGRCIYRVLLPPPGRTLAPRWTLSDVGISPLPGSTFEWLAAPALGTAQPGFEFRVEIVDPDIAGSIASGRIRTIVLRGPEGRDWTEAFRP